MKTNIDSKTFCVAPWFMARNSNLGEYEICCITNKKQTEFNGKVDFYITKDNIEDWLNSDYLNYVRNSLAQGNYIKECDICWKREEKNQRSLRQIYNQEILEHENIENTWANNYFKNNSHEHYGFVVGADIKLNNVCNFACVMCKPHDSSLIASDWQKNTQHPFIAKQLKKSPQYLQTISEIYKEDLAHDLLDYIVNQPRLKFLKVLGGEPLLDKKLFSILNSKSNKEKTQLMFVTNGSVSLTQTAQHLEEYDFLHFTVSVEGYNTYNNYIRKHSDWESISKNIMDAKNIKNAKVSVGSTIQALSLCTITNLITWCRDNHIEWSYDLCFKPDYLSINALPQQYFDKHIKNIQKVDLELANYLVSQYNDNSDVHKHDFLQYLNWYNKNDFVVFKELYPDLYKFLNKADISNSKTNGNIT